MKATVTDLPNSTGKKKSRCRNEQFQFGNENSTAKKKNLLAVLFDYKTNSFRSEKMHAGKFDLLIYSAGMKEKQIYRENKITIGEKDGEEV